MSHLIGKVAVVLLGFRDQRLKSIDANSNRNFTLNVGRYWWSRQMLRLPPLQPRAGHQ